MFFREQIHCTTTIYFPETKPQREACTRAVHRYITHATRTHLSKFTSLQQFTIKRLELSHHTVQFLVQLNHWRAVALRNKKKTAQNTPFIPLTFEALPCIAASHPILPHGGILISR